MSNFYNPGPQVSPPFNQLQSWGQNPQQQTIQPNMQPVQQVNPNMQEPPIVVIPVNGEQMAKMYPVERGRTILLMDFTNKRFWIKSIKPNGLEEACDGFSFIGDSDVAAQQTQVQNDKARLQQLQASFVSRSEFDELKKIIDELTK